MSLSKVSATVRKGVVARIVAGRSTAALEAKKYGVRPALVRGWVHEEKMKLKEGGSVPPNPETTPPPTPPDPTSNDPGVGSAPKAPSPAAADPDAAARARAAAGISAPSGASGPSVPSRPSGPDAEAALRVADEEEKKLVLETYQATKKGLVEILARRTGLDPLDPLLVAAAEPSAVVKMVLSTNAGLIAPMIRGKLVGWPAVAGVLVFEAVVTMMAIRDVAVARGKVKDKPAAPPPAAARPA